MFDAFRNDDIVENRPFRPSVWKDVLITLFFFGVMLLGGLLDG